MKKLGLISGIFIGLASICALGFGTLTKPVQVLADDSESEPLDVSEDVSEEETSESEATFECSVVIAETVHGEVSVDKTEGHVGDVVTVIAKHDICYLIESANVNGTALIEDEETSGLFKFSLVEGVNTITVKFAIDKELLGELSVIVDQAANKDWSNLFSVENVIRIVSWLLSGGLLVAMVRYFIKDKRLEKKVEDTVKETVTKIIPETTKQTVLDTIETQITPIFAQVTASIEDIMRALAVYSKCMALSQENTPESRRAILDELSGLKIGDFNTIEEAKKYIEASMAAHRVEMAEMLDKISKIAEENKAIVAKYEAESGSEQVNEEEPTEAEEVNDNGTQI